MNKSLNLSHQEGLFQKSSARPLTVIGLGAVGSIVVESFARVGFDDITVIDFDSVDSHNIPMSGYGIKDVGFYKTERLHRKVAYTTGVELKVVQGKYLGEPLKTPIVISCVDDMGVRAKIWEQVKNNISVELLCDTRLARAYVEILSIRPCNEDDQNKYEALMCAQKDTVRQVCGYHGIIYASLYAASVVVPNVLQYLESGEVPKWRDARKCDTLSQVF